ncbi:strawberry notch C-terminal domain-containing protein [Nostoc sp. ChiQUE01b]|uniref:strawberry notch C-terminal domain-containing protein n=1 Tax=Nostoc sp. ChiQUE01b TaxID=3075376 RepID=UPI002AD20357|nr:strawberry notch C-terminal domain-containing protein [Nostoc sp. ChiQUE01b]
MDEVVESALVRVAQDIVTGAATPQDAYRQLVELHNRQPALNVRSSTSVAQQAYSTPLPIAYLASVLAGVNSDTTVYEPSAGHGALLLGATPDKVTVNELNPARAGDLREQGYTVTEADASRFTPSQLHDVVIMNPPFGTVDASPGRPKQFQFGKFQTTQIDHAIALQGLSAMKPDGRAVLILGGKLGMDEDIRSDRYNSRESRGFYYTLYQNFNVVDHFSIFGNLYRKQGAGFPIDMIVIDGRGKSDRRLPAADVPRLYRTFDELGEFLDDVLSRSERVVAPGGGASFHSASTSERNPVESEPLSGTAVPSLGMADRDVDGGGGSVGRGDTRDAPSEDAPVLNLSAQTDVTGDTPHAPRDTGMADSLGAVPGVRERHYRIAAAISGNLVSGAGGNEQRTDRTTTVEIQHAGRTADTGGVADRNNRPATTVEQPKQLPYHPKSGARAIGTLVPANMQTGVNQALLKLERQVAELDAYVADRLAYGTTEELHQHFSAEQVDAIALAVSNLEKGGGFILGDQTGIGKGRVVAGMIRYANVTGRTPIFVTKDPALYADMIRDLEDIGMPRFNPLVTNPDLTLPLPDGRTLSTNTKQHHQVLKRIQADGDLGRYDAIFTTYSQLQTVKRQEPYRRDFLRQFAPNSLVILDESHEAGGSNNKNAKSAGASNRADFVRELVQRSLGVVYSSATYAKNPQVMDLYSRTDMRLALSNMANLTELVASGGVPLQQTLASMLTESGQYIRRERSFEGVRFDSVVAPVNHDVAENISLIMAEIMEFDRLKQDVVEGMDKDLKAEAKRAFGDNATGAAGATSTNFTSLMHNIVDQMLFALKAEETVQQSLSLLRQPEPEKPVLALSNTMGSMIGRQAEMLDLRPGDTLDADFGTILHRYLDRSRDVILGNPYGEKTCHRLTDEELGIAATARYHAIQDLINETDFSQIPVSPIDYITFRLNQEGYRVGEVTGREHIALYNADGTTVYQRRGNAERSKEAAVRTVNAFNDGQLDVILLNRSGSTGISLHASERFRDQRQRHMIVAQPEADINSFMQMLGRVHRTGQVVPPNFTLLMADIPAEKRPGAVLARKMASLNANTTAARSGAFSLENVPDFMNEYGDRVIIELMKAYPDIHERLDYPLQASHNPLHGTLSAGDSIRKVTGRIPLLPIAEQSALYDLIEKKYTEFVATQEAMGESILEASTLNLDAKTLARMEVLPSDANSHSPFTGAVYAEIVDVKTPRKPYTTLMVVQKLHDSLGLSPPDTVTDATQSSIQQASCEQVKADIEALEEQARQYKLQVPADRSSTIDNQFYQVTHMMQALTVGQAVCLTTEKNDVFYGVVAGVNHTGVAANPVAPSSWEIRLLLADSVQELSLPLSQVNTGKENAVRVEGTDKTPEGTAVYDLFDYYQTRTREKRQMFTGNLLRAWEKFPGKMVNFTDAHGNIRQGLLTSRGFDAEAALEQMGVTMPTVEDAWRFLTEQGGQLKTADKHLTIKLGQGGTFLLQTPKAKDAGGKYYLDEELLEAAGAEFYSVGDRMECLVDGEALEAVLAFVMRERDYALAAYEQREAARAMLGIALGTFAEVAEMPVAVPETPSPVPEPDMESGISTDSVNKLPSAITPPAAQRGTPEKNIAKLLERGGLSSTVMKGEEFHHKIENEPFIPLVIERHDDRLYLTHYLTENGDTFINSEMIFTIDTDGGLTLAETAVTSLGREWRNCDRSYATTFSRNLLHQGFGEAMRKQLSLNSQTRGEREFTFTDSEEQSLENPALALTFSISSQSETIPENSLPEANEENAEASDALSIQTWLQAVRDLGLESERRHHMQTLENAQESAPLSRYLQNIIEGDLAKYRPYQERGQVLLETVQLLLATEAQLDIWGGVSLKHGRYECTQQGDKLTVQARTGSKAETILQVNGDSLERTTVREKDVEHFLKLAEHSGVQFMQEISALKQR